MNKLMLVMLLATGNVYAIVNVIDSPDGVYVGADFPCSSKAKEVISATGGVKALTCSVVRENGCAFLLTKANLEQGQYKLHGMRFIEAIHSEYAKMLGPHESISSIKSQYGKIGPSLNYELLVNVGGHSMHVNGIWIVYGDQLLRITTSCTLPVHKFMKGKRIRFLDSVTVTK